MILQAVVPFVLYMLILIVIGYYSTTIVRKSNNLVAFFVGDRNIGGMLTGFSHMFSGASGWVYIGFVGIVYTIGISAYYVVIGLVTGTLVSYIVIGERLRKYAGKLESVSYVDYFAYRFKEQSLLIRLIGITSILIFMTVLMAAEVIAGGKTFSILLGIDMNIANYTMTIVVIVYTLMGGYIARAYTDLFQGWLVIFVSLALAVLVLYHGGGPSAIHANLLAQNIELVSITGGKTGGALASFVFGMVAIGLAVIGRPHDSVAFMAAKDVRAVRKASVSAVGGQFSILLFATLVGLGARAILPELSASESAFPAVVEAVSPPWFAGVVAASLAALIMSTMCGALVVASSAASRDISQVIQQVRNRPEVDGSGMVWIARASVILVGGIGLYIAQRGGSVFALALYASSGLAATFGPVCILSLYWQRITSWGAIAGMLVGLCMTIFWYMHKPIAFVPEVLVGFVSSFIAAIVVSKLTRVTASATDIAEDFAALGWLKTPTAGAAKTLTD